MKEILVTVTIEDKQNSSLWPSRPVQVHWIDFKLSQNF